MAKLFFCGIIVAAICSGSTPTLRPMTPAEKAAALAQRDLLRASRSSAKPAGDRQMYVFTGDVVVPQFVDGDGWKTTITLTNMKANSTQVDILLFTDSGGDLFVDVAGVGRTDTISVTLAGGASATVETLGTATTLGQGWAYLYCADQRLEVGSLTVFRQRVAGRPDLEAAIPTVSEYDGRFVLVYDNTQGYTTAMAMANPDTSGITVLATVRDENGTVIFRDSISVPRLGKVIVTLPDRWPSTANKRGSVEFQSSGWGASAMGLRFNPTGAFTSFHVLSNISWIL